MRVCVHACGSVFCPPVKMCLCSRIYLAFFVLVPQGLKDCEECLRRKPDFVKAYIRKGFLHFAMKDYNKALEVYDKGLMLDPNNEELKQNVQQVRVRTHQ